MQEQSDYSENQMPSSETLTVTELCPPEGSYDEEAQAVLSDFEQLDFIKNPCNDPTDGINYNDDNDANPFNKISKHYGRKKNVFFFISMLRDEQQLKKITEIIKGKCDEAAKEKFIQKINMYLSRIEKGEHDVEECLMNNDFRDAFFHGYYHGEERNVHENLNINFTKMGQVLEVAPVFNNTIQRMEDEKSEVKKIKVYSNGTRIGSVDKKEQQQRDYSFNKNCSCQLAVNWIAENKSGSSHRCTILFDINSGKINNVRFEIDGENAELGKGLNLAKQNEAVLIKGKSLRKVLQKYLKSAVDE